MRDTGLFYQCNFNHDGVSTNIYECNDMLKAMIVEEEINACCAKILSATKLRVISMEYAPTDRSTKRCESDEGVTEEPFPVGWVFPMKRKVAQLN